MGEIVRVMQEQSAPDWNAYALIASIEEGRLSDHNPPVPAQLAAGYQNAWKALLPMALRDLEQANGDFSVRSILAVIAHAKGQHSLAIIALCTEDEKLEMLST